MNQLTQNLKNGHMEILEVPFPALGKGQVLVRTHYSVISAGTEGKTVKDARAGYLSKARARQKEVKQVLNLVRTQGLKTTYAMVMNKLEAPSALGYSCAGEVITVGEGVSNYRMGDRVACAGNSAVHAEVVAVPANLCALIPEGVEMRQAAFATIAAIALQGIRQADLRLGENCVVIGLGLVGQLTLQLLAAGGIRALGIDIAPEAVALARQAGARAMERTQPDLEAVIRNESRGQGADAVIITAATSSLDPVNLAGTLCRQKAKVVVVGAVPTGFQRGNYYKKELELRMSCSYGPGRYDREFEEKGVAYPIGYVRWTEQRNLQAFLDLLAAGRLNLDPLITQEFPFNEAPRAYDLVLKKSQPFCGIVLRYDAEKAVSQRVELRRAAGQAGREAHVGFIGAGSFAQSFLLPNVAKRAVLVGVATARPNNARYIADKYGFAYATADADEIIADASINTVFIATRHNLHSEYVLKALQAGKYVFVEKPLALTPGDLEEIKSLYEAILNRESPGQSPMVMVGFNRRFAPLVAEIHHRLPTEAPRAILYRINAGSLPPEHWAHDPDVGGGRIIGEVCHFVDLCCYLAGAKISSLSAQVMEVVGGRNDTLTVQLQFCNGSVATIAYCSNGGKALPKEYLEVFCQGQVMVLENFRRLNIYGAKRKTIKNSSQDKGHQEEVRRFLECISNGHPAPISFEEIYQSSHATFQIVESIRQGGTRLALSL